MSVSNIFNTPQMKTAIAVSFRLRSSRPTVETAIAAQEDLQKFLFANHIL